MIKLKERPFRRKLYDSKEKVGKQMKCWKDMLRAHLKGLPASKLAFFSLDYSAKIKLPTEFTLTCSLSSVSNAEFKALIR